MHNLALTYAKLGRQADALKLREEVMPLMQAKVGSDHPITIRSMAALAASYTLAGREVEALKLSEETVALSQAKLGPTHPDTLDYMKRLASLLATCRDAKSRDPARAVELAKKVVEEMPNDGQLWHTLGVAHFRASNWQASVAALHRAMELRKGGDSFDFLFLAMAQWQLGNKDEARQRYDRVVAWMSKNDPKNESLTRLRSEAAELLGVTEKSQ
jgi:predicted Zn-dependent protease